jgi:hypothetical protein
MVKLHPNQATERNLSDSNPTPTDQALNQPIIDISVASKDILNGILGQMILEIVIQERVFIDQQVEFLENQREINIEKHRALQIEEKHRAQKTQKFKNRLSMVSYCVPIAIFFALGIIVGCIYAYNSNARIDCGSHSICRMMTINKK